MYLTKALLRVVISDVCHECRNRDASVLQHERIKPDWSIVDVPDGHCHYVHEEHQRVLRLHGILGIHTFCTNERQIQLHGLQMQEFEINVLALFLALWLGDPEILVA